MLRRLFHLLPLILITIVFSGCGPRTTSTAEAPLATVSPEATRVIETDLPDAIATVAATEIPAEVKYPRPHYQLDVQFDYAARLLSVHQLITYVTRAEVSELVFEVEPNRYPGAFQLKSAKVNSSGIATLDLPENDNRLTLPLSDSVPAGSSLQVELEFTLKLPAIPDPSDERRPELFGYTERQVNLVDWFPQIAFYQDDKDWLVHSAWYYGEHQVYEAADFDIELRLKQEVPNLVLAASSIAVEENGAYRYHLEGGRNFAISASQQYVQATQQVGNVLVRAYAFPYDSTANEDVLDYVAEALELYSEVYGPYPHTSLDVVEADFLDGMEFEGLFFLSRGFYNIYDGQPGSYLAAIAVHETAHQWWYSQVGNDQAKEPWLDEAFCTFSERLYYEKLHPESLQWWQQVRVDFYAPEGFIDGSIDSYQGYIPYRNAVYLRGAQFLTDLRTTMGEDAFYSALRQIVATYQFDSLLTVETFFQIIGQFSPADLSVLRQEYFAP